MNTQEAKEFFEQVKGKKIQWNLWRKHAWGAVIYFIPHVFHQTYHGQANVMEGAIYSSGVSTGTATILVSRGFNENTEGYWTFLEEAKVPEKPVCNCPSDILFNLGCKCGCIEAEREYRFA